MISYASGIKGSSTAIWADDKIESLKELNYSLILLTNISSRSPNDIKTYKTSSISKKDFIREKNICYTDYNLKLSLLKSIIPLSLGIVLDFFLEFFSKGHGESRWSWSISSFFVGLKICFTNKIDTIYTTGGAGSAHLVGILLKLFFKNKKLIVELQDPLIGDDIGRNSNTSKYFSFFEKLIVKHSNKVIYVTRNAAKEAFKRHNSENIKYVYPGSRNFNLNTEFQTLDRDKLKIIHLGTLYSNRNFNNLIKAIENLIKKKIISDNIEILNIGDIHCSEKQYYLSKSYIKQLPILNRIKALDNLNNCDICLLIQHTDKRSHLTIPYKLYDYLNTKKLIFGLTSNVELNELLDRGGHFFADSRDVQSIEIVLTDMIIKKKKNSFYKPLDLKININAQTKKIFE